MAIMDQQCCYPQVQVRIQLQYSLNQNMEIHSNCPPIELAEEILDKDNYSLMAAALQSLQAQSQAIHRDVIEALKTLLILQPEQIYTRQSNLTIDRIRLIRDIFKIESNIDAKYFETTSGYILLAVAQGFLLQNLTPERMNKLRQVFARKIQRGANLWGFDQLQSFQAFLLDKSTGYLPNSSPIHHDREIDRFYYFLQFYENYQQVFPQMTDILSILFKMMLCLREERERDRQLMARIKQKYLEGRYHYQTTTKNMKFVLEFFKHPYSEKDCLYYPQKALQSILASYSLEQILHLLQATSVGVLWQQSQVYEYFLNCIKLGFTQISRKMMISMIKFCEKSGKFNQLLHSYENHIKKIFVFMKFTKFFNPCMEILKFFIYSPPPTLAIYEKFLPQVVVFMGKVDKQQKYVFLNLLQVVSHAYKDSAPMQELTKIIEDNIENEVNRLTEEEIKKILEEYSWKQKMLNRNNSLNVVTENKPKSNYKGLTNIGNSCYMNSFLQSLFMNREFLRHIIRSSTLQIRNEKLKDKRYEGKSREYIEKEIQDSVKPFAQLQKTFAMLLKSIRNEVSPSNIRLVAPQMFRNSSQHDTIQFGRCFLDLIFRNNIPAMFQGEVTTQIFCKQCSQVRQRKQAFLDYHVSTESGQLQQLILSSFKQQIVQDLTCDHCQKKGKESIKHHFISKFPNYLIVSINRFEYDVIEKRNKKNKSKIIVNPFLKIAEIEYQVYSIIIHTGPSPNAGHYFTFSKTKYQPNCKWICHNDSQVSQFQDFAQVNSFLENSEEDTPYIVFYQKKDHIQKMKEQLSQPIVLRDPQQKFVRKENETFLASQKKVKFQLQPIKYNFFMREDEDQDQRGSGGGGFYNNYIA